MYNIPRDDELVEVGCAFCGERCDYTNETDPPLTRQRAEIWAGLHSLVCPALCQCEQD
jgi:hypothetical protein